MARGITQSYFLGAFIDEIVRTGGAALAGAGPPPTREALEAEFERVALAAATGLFGEATPISVELTADLGDVVVFQVLDVVAEVTDPRRQVPVQAVQAAGHAVDAGDSLVQRIYYTGDPRDEEAISRARTQLAAVLPLPVHSPELWVRLTSALNDALLRYFPGPTFAADSLGGLLTAGGGWTRGLSARQGELEIEIGCGFLEFYRTRVSGGWVEYGFEVTVRRGGVAVFRGGRGHVEQPLGDGEDAPSAATLCKGDNDGIVASWAVLTTSEAARPGFVAALQAIVDALAGGRSMNGHSDADALLVAAIRPPVAGGFWEWTQEALPRLLTRASHTIESGGTHVLFEISEVYPPGVGLVYFGHSAVRVVGLSDDPEIVPNPEGEPLQTGAVGPDALSLRGPEDEVERRDLEAIVATFREWLAVHLDHHVANRGLADIEGFNYFYAFDGYFPLVQLLEQRLRWGPPGDPPVPPFTEAALARAAQLVEPSEAGGEHVLAAFSALGWTIVLEDDTGERPFGSYCGISLVPPDGGATVAVMMVDAWNPEARTVVDGDAFAFRRFVTWLREAIVRGDLDEVHTFRATSDEEDDEDDEGNEEEEGPSEVEISLSEWLLFGLPDVGDSFLVDWRAQWHIVNAVRRVDDFAGIYGFSGAHVERLRTRDAVLWRRFLREVIDPRFARTIGERLINPA